jgi:acetoacetate decarboxylase
LHAEVYLVWLRLPGSDEHLSSIVTNAARRLECIDSEVKDIVLKSAWTGPAALCLAPHALAPVAELPVREIVSAIHIVADLTLGLGRVVHDYLQRPNRQSLPIGEESLAT